MAKTAGKGIQAAVVNPEKIVKGMTTIFQGFSIMFDGMAEQMQQMEGLAEQMAAGQQAPAVPAKNEPDTQEGQESAKAGDSGEDLPFDTAPEDKKAAATITTDDLLKIAAQKITANRKNSPKIKALLTSYGCGAVSELPEDKREAFLNDLAQL